MYLVSHGGAAFPDIVVILQGEGVTLDLVGSIDIKGAVTSSTFATVPDAPITSFQLTLPEGSHSALGTDIPAKAKGSLCGLSLVMPTTLTGQNGAVVKQSTKIAVTGCPKAKKKPKAKKPKHRRTARARGRRVGPVGSGVGEVAVTVMVSRKPGVGARGVRPAPEGVSGGRGVPVRVGSEDPAPGRVGEIQRQRIIGAIAQVAAERGAANATVAQVVARAGYFEAYVL